MTLIGLQAFGPLILFLQAVKAHLGRGDQIFCGIVQLVKLFTSGIGYTVTGSLSLVAAKRAVCFHKHSHILPKQAPCSFNNIPWMIFFGVLQFLFSQIPDIGSMWWLSYVATIMSFAYAFIGLGLAIDKVTEKGHPDYGTAFGMVYDQPPAKATWNTFNALGAMAFAYSFTSFYMAIGTVSYAAFGNTTPGNLLTGFGYFNPYWLVTAANVFVFIHLIGGYQVYMQPVMDAIEEYIRMFFPHVPLFHYQHNLNIYGFILPISPLKLINRSIIVCVTTVMACIFPFFNAIVGLMGAIAFFPMTLHLVIHKVAKYSRRWWLVNTLSFICFCVSASAAIGSVANIITALKTFKPFTSVSASVASG